MNKIWRIVSGVALACLILGAVCIGIGFFSGSSPVLLREHGALEEFVRRLQINWALLRQDIGALLALLGL